MYGVNNGGARRDREYARRYLEPQSRTRARPSNRPSGRTSKADNPVFNFKNDALSESPECVRRVRPSRSFALEGGKKTDGRQIKVRFVRGTERGGRRGKRPLYPSPRPRDVEASRCTPYGVGTRGRNKTSEGNARSKRREEE